MTGQRNKNKFALVLLILILMGCSTQKNTFVTRTYHNITARYNIFFNGYESFNGGILKLENQYRDDYTSIIPVFNYNNEDIAQGIAPEMDRAINKSTKVITFHSITAKPKTKKKYLTEKDKAFLQKNEYNKWIDDSYLLMGKSHFYKHDYSLAVETFNFLIKKFNEEPSRHEALIWLTRSYNEKEDFRESEKLLTLLQSDMYFPKKLRSGYNATYADYYLKQEEIDKSIPRLELALKYAKKKKHKLRYYYLLAQLYQETGETAKAADMYRKVIKMNPPYEITFNARMNLASVYKSESGKGKNIREQLLKMLKDEKNKEYQDQIYYALGQIEMADKNIEKALDYFKFSAQKSMTNDKQKAKAYLTVADIYYGRPDYKMAQAYYDSAVVLLDESYPGYDIIFNKSEDLSILVADLTTIEVEDSLQALARMTSHERLKKIDAAIQQLLAEEQAAKQKEREEIMDAQFDRMTYETNKNITSATQGTNWYFYNTTAVSMGKREFEIKWGKRKLEDNWRRSVKRTIHEEEIKESQGETGQMPAEKVNLVTDRRKREYYLQYLPLTDSLMVESHKRIVEAFYEAGAIYKNELLDYNQAIEMFKELNRRYPDNKYAVAVYYELYKTNLQINNINAAENFKNLIISNYLNTIYAKVLTNPDYFKELEAEQRKVSDLYENTYNNFKNGYYTDVILNADMAGKEFPDNVLIPKFRFLRALAIGKTQDPILFSEELKQIIADFPGSEVKPEAENLLVYLSRTDETVKEKEDQIIKEEKQAEAEEIYIWEDNVSYYYVIVVDNKANVNQLNFNLINYNLDNYLENNFETAREDLGNNYKLVRVFTLKSQKEAVNYLQAIENVNELFNDVNALETISFVISANNYQALIKDKSVEKYLLFYQKYYLAK